MAYNMKGWSGFQNSPITKKAGPETKQFDADKDAQQAFEDRESAIENAVNNYWPSADTEKFTPSEKQIAIELKKIKAERKAGY